MACAAGPDVSESGLVLALDGANYKSFKGEATTNLSRNSRDFSGTAYASSDEWVSSEPTRLTKTYISSIITPIGNGATLIQESGTAGYHHLSRWGGGDESGAHSLSCYVFPLTSDITDFVIGMLGDGVNQISFNLNTREITYGPGISNRDAFITPVVGFDGWYRVGANIEGRSGGWVGCIGYTTSAVYTGTSGNKKCYITGIQYELKTTPTMFTEAQTTRGTTVATGGGWADLIGNGNNGELVNGVRENSANGGSLVFDGVDDYISIPENSALNTQTPTVEVWVKTNATSQNGFWFEKGQVNTQYSLFQEGGVIQWRMNLDGSVNNLSTTTATYMNTSNWYQVVGTYTSGSRKLYINGTLVNSDAQTGTIITNANGMSIGAFGGFNPGGNGRGYYYNGNIASVKIYNRALTAAEIQQNFNATRGRFGI